MMNTNFQGKSADVMVHPTPTPTPTPPAVQLSSSSSAAAASVEAATTTAAAAAATTTSILTDDDNIVEHIFHYVGNKHYRFIAPICKQYHRMYTTRVPTTFTTAVAVPTTRDSASRNDANYRQPATTRTKQTYINCSTIQHMTICYNDIFHTVTPDIMDEDYYERQQREEKQVSHKDMFYTCIGRTANVALLEYLYNVLHCPYNIQVCNAAAAAATSEQQLHIIQYLYENWGRLQQQQQQQQQQLWDKSTSAIAVERGHLNIVQYLHIHHCPWDKCSALSAAKNGHWHILQYMDDQQFDFQSLSICRDTWLQIGTNGRLDICQFFEDKKCDVSYEYVCYGAGMNNHVELYLYTFPKLRSSEMKRCCCAAASSGNLDLVQHVRRKYNGRAGMCTAASASGHLHILQYLRNHNFVWDESTCSEAATNGHLHVIQYAHDNGCPWDEATCTAAAKNGYLHVLRYAHENGCRWNTETCTQAARSGNLDVLQYAHSEGCPWNKETCWAAASSGHLDCLQYAYENGCEFNYLTCVKAAENGHLHILKYARENGLLERHDDKVSEYAAKRGDLEMLQYAHESGCKLYSFVWKQAATLGHLKMLQYAHDNGCPGDAAFICEKATKHGDLKTLQYAHEKGCPYHGSLRYVAASCRYRYSDYCFFELQDTCGKGCILKQINSTGNESIDEWIKLTIDKKKRKRKTVA